MSSSPKPWWFFSLISVALLPALTAEPYPFARATPFAPTYRPDCDLLLPASLASSGPTPSSQPPLPLSSTGSFREPSPYYNVPSSHLSGQDHMLTTNELSTDGYDLVRLFDKHFGGIGGKEESTVFNYQPSQVASASYQYLSAFTSGLSKRSSYIPGGHICITYEDIDRAVSEAKMMLGIFAPPYEVKELSSDFPKPQHVNKVGEILIQASAILARNHGLSKEAILYALPRIDTYKTSIRDLCPTFLKPVKCELSKYRTLSGMCNNLDYPSWGSARSAMLRFLPPDYADAKDDKPIQCCKYPPEQRHRSCYPISMPADDPFYKFFNKQCMDFIRSMAGVKPNCPLGPRHQINAVSSYIDANFVYGNAQSTTKRIREYSGGRLKTTSLHRGLGFKDLLPMKTQNPDSGCERSGHARSLYCFDSGDDRSNEQLQLAVMHTLWMREHNRIADKLYALNPHWSDEKLFQETRRIIGAMVQHITFNEFLPIVVGRKTMTKYGINLLKYDYYNGYDPKINPGIRVEFQASAFRFGHSILPDTTERYNKFHEKLESIRLSSMLRQPYSLYRPGIVDTFIMGLVNQPAYRVDSEITTEVTNHLFEKPGENFGMDLASINVARAREMGIPGYNDIREYCNLPRIKRFEDLYGLVENSTIRRYINLYEHVDDIDFWSVGIAEYPLMGAMVGPTFACIIADQFSHIRRGDRFWYENEGWPSQFSIEQLAELRKVKLARLLCENGDDLDTIQLYPLLAAHPTSNPRVSCHELPALDLSYWRESSYFGSSPLDQYNGAAKAAASKAKAAK